MKLRDLIDPDWPGGFIKREVRACAVGAPGCNTLSPHDSHEYLVHVPTIDEADGIWFACPKCFTENKGFVGTHSVICWRPRVPLDVKPLPGRWEFQGTSLDDLTLVAGSSSVALTGGCAAHFFIRNGEIVMA